MALPANAAVLTFDTSQSQFLATSDNQGYITPLYGDVSLNDNYVVGWLGSLEYRNYFTFDLSTLVDEVIGAKLEVARHDYRGDASETLGLFSVETDAATLNNNLAPFATLFADLGSGTSYGTFEVESYATSRSELLSFSLNSAAVADISAAAGGFFSIGGALQSIAGVTGNQEGLFFGSGGTSSFNGIQRLVIQTKDAPVFVPEPGGAALLMVGLLGIAFRRRRQHLQS